MLVWVTDLPVILHHCPRTMRFVTFILVSYIFLYFKALKHISCTILHFVGWVCKMCRQNCNLEHWVNQVTWPRDWTILSFDLGINLPSWINFVYLSTDCVIIIQQLTIEHGNTNKFSLTVLTQHIQINGQCFLLLTLFSVNQLYYLAKVKQIQCSNCSPLFTE